MSATNRQASEAIRVYQAALVQEAVAHASDATSAAGMPPCLPRHAPTPGEHLAYLAEAVAQDDPRLFDDYVRWLQAFLAAPCTGPDVVHHLLEDLQWAIGQVLPAPLAAAVEPFVSSAEAVRQGARPGEPPGRRSTLRRLARITWQRS
jgi:hypothetical protein